MPGCKRHASLRPTAGLLARCIALLRAGHETRPLRTSALQLRLPLHEEIDHVIEIHLLLCRYGLGALCRRRRGRELPAAARRRERRRAATQRAPERGPLLREARWPGPCGGQLLHGAWRGAAAGALGRGGALNAQVGGYSCCARDEGRRWLCSFLDTGSALQSVSRCVLPASQRGASGQ